MSLVEEWLRWCREDRRLAANTVATYARTLRTVPNVETADRAAIETWWATRTHLSAATRNNELSALRRFYDWCRRFEHRPATDDPTHRIIAPKMPKGLPHPISRDDLQRLLDTLPPDLRRAVCLGAYAGLRVSEAAALDWSSVDPEARRMYVTGKGRTRVVGVSPILRDALLPVTGGNVVTGGGVAYSAAALQRRINRAIRNAGIEATFHALRHRFGTVALGATGNLLSVSRAMGHASPATTAIYAATADSDLDVIAEAVSR